MKYGTSLRQRHLVGRFEKGEEVLDALRRMCARERIRAASITGIGVLTQADVQSFDPVAREYRTTFSADTPLELVQLTGNVSTLGDELIINLAATVAYDAYGNRVLVGGHLASAKVHTLEFALVAYDDVMLERTFDASTGLPLWNRIGGAALAELSGSAPLASEGRASGRPSEAAPDASTAAAAVSPSVHVAKPVTPPTVVRRGASPEPARVEPEQPARVEPAKPARVEPAKPARIEPAKPAAKPAPKPAPPVVKAAPKPEPEPEADDEDEFAITDEEMAALRAEYGEDAEDDDDFDDDFGDDDEDDEDDVAARPAAKSAWDAAIQTAQRSDKAPPPSLHKPTTVAGTQRRASTLAPSFDDEPEEDEFDVEMGDILLHPALGECTVTQVLDDDAVYIRVGRKRPRKFALRMFRTEWVEERDGKNVFQLIKKESGRRRR